MPDQANRRLPGGTEASAEHARVHPDNRRDGLSALLRLLIGHSLKKRTRSARQCERPIVRWVTRSHCYDSTRYDCCFVVLRTAGEGGAVLDCWMDGLHRRGSVELHKEAQNARPSGMVGGILIHRSCRDWLAQWSPATDLSASVMLAFSHRVLRDN